MFHITSDKLKYLNFAKTDFLLQIIRIQKEFQLTDGEVLVILKQLQSTIGDKHETKRRKNNNKNIF